MSANAYERIYRLTTAPYVFVGQKPAAVLFGEERIEVKTWRRVYAVILDRYNQEPEQHETLLYLRGRAAGKIRAFLADTPDGMTRPHRIDDGLYGETHYGSQTLMHILVNRILLPVGFDCSNIRIVLKSK